MFYIFKETQQYKKILHYGAEVQQQSVLNVTKVDRHCAEGEKSQFYILTYQIIGLINSWGIRLHNDIVVNYVWHTCYNMYKADSRDVKRETPL